MTSTFKTCALLLGAATLFACAWLGAAPHALAPFASQPTPPATNATPALAAHFASSDLEDFVHSASITGLPGGDLLAHLVAVLVAPQARDEQEPEHDDADAEAGEREEAPDAGRDGVRIELGVLLGEQQSRARSDVRDHDVRDHAPSSIPWNRSASNSLVATRDAASR